MQKRVLPLKEPPCTSPTPCGEIEVDLRRAEVKGLCRRLRKKTNTKNKAYIITHVAGSALFSLHLQGSTDQTKTAARTLQRMLGLYMLGELGRSSHAPEQDAGSRCQMPGWIVQSRTKDCKRVFRSSQRTYQLHMARSNFIAANRLSTEILAPYQMVAMPTH